VPPLSQAGVEDTGAGITSGGDAVDWSMMGPVVAAAVCAAALLGFLVYAAWRCRKLRSLEELAVASATTDEIVMDDALGSATAMPVPKPSLSPGGGGSRKKTFDGRTSGPTWTRVGEPNEHISCAKLDASVGVAHEISIERV